MPSIKLLSKQLASQIAAGEVVERPSSVVKELLENAVDARGTHILCEIRSAGKILIRVRDNGVGIVKDELPLALAPHATSKIYSVDDLASIQTLGFRGEALASIASVSKLTLTSKTKEEDNGFCVKVEGPEQNPVIAPAPHPDGTTVDVEELFFNTPARRRFLKSDRTEFLRIKDTFVRVALAHPELSFELISDNKSIFRVNKANTDIGIDHKRTATLIGSDFSNEGILVTCENPHLKIDGMLLPPPSVEQSLSEQIYLFLNGRPIADKVVTHALKEGFYEVLGKTLPIRCVLYISIDPSEVDVNVHPRKDEVRFHETSLVHDLVTDSIVLALRKAGIRPYKDNQSELDIDTSLIDNSALNSEFINQSQTQSPHVSSFDINDSSLPAFPTGVSSFIDINKTSDRGAPVIIKAGSSNNFDNQSQNTQSSFNSNNFGSSFNKATSFNQVSSQDNAQEHFSQIGTLNTQNYSKDVLNRNINLYKSSVEASNFSLNAKTNLETNDKRHYVYQNGIELLDYIDANTVLVKSENKYFLLNINALKQYFNARDYKNAVCSNNVESLKLTIPYIIKTDDSNLVKALKNSLHAVSKCGFEITLSKTKIEIKSLPQAIKGANIAAFAIKLFFLITASSKSIDEGECPIQLADLISQNYQHGMNSVLAEDLISRVDNTNTLIENKSFALELNLKQLAIKFGEQHEK